jgi:CO dehydrogenase maturation factor
MKIAISGKGGVGKTTISAYLINRLAASGLKVLAIDADPDANLGQALGMEGADELPPISSMKDLIQERTEAQPGYGGWFKMNPKVDDIPEKISLKKGNIRLLVMGGIDSGGSGCVCPESVFLKNLMNHLILGRKDALVMDMEAGIEHLGRGTAQSVDRLLVVVEPGSRSVATAKRVRALASEIGLKKISIVGNKVRSAKDEEFLKKNLQGFEFVGFIPYDDAIIEADLRGGPPEGLKKETSRALDSIAARFEKEEA